MRVLTGGEMEDVERRAVEATGVPLSELMERAGAAVADRALRMARRGPVVIVSGKGNNGGDGIVAARILAEAGLEARLFVLADRDELTPESATALKRLDSSDAAVEPIFLDPSNEPDAFVRALGGARLVVDCIFGFSLRGPVRGAAAEAIRAINTSGLPVLAADVPSGVEADTGVAGPDAVRASRTVTFTAPKIGLVVSPGDELAGTVDVADIGIPPDLLEEVGSVDLIDSRMVAGMLPGRDRDDHKKSVGRVLVVAGSVGMTGAACLAAQAALRAGAGIVSLAVPQSLNDVFEQQLTEVMTIPLPETPARSLDAVAADTILELCSGFDSLVVGPGLSLDGSTQALVRTIVTHASLPIVLDADGLNAMIDHLDVLKKSAARLVLTPHSGELARLLQVTSDEVQADRLEHAKRSAAELGAITVLKGARTLVSDGRTLLVNPTGNPGLATAGTGDVLAGMIGSLVAQGASPLDAAASAVYVHGLAGDLAARKLTERCVIATDVISFLPKAFARLAGAVSDKVGER